MPHMLVLHCMHVGMQHSITAGLLHLTTEGHPHMACKMACIHLLGCCNLQVKKDVCIRLITGSSCLPKPCPAHMWQCECAMHIICECMPSNVLPDLSKRSNTLSMQGCLQKPRSCGYQAVLAPKFENHKFEV